MWVSELWRFPVKSMGGERLELAEIKADGIAGDRLVHVRDQKRGRVLNARSHPELLGHRAVLGPDGEPLVDDRPWREVELPGMKLVYDASEDRFDILPLLVATDGAIQAFGYDSRRLRPNIVIAGVEGLAEREWEGRILRIGRVVLRAETLRRRCIMTTFDPDTQEQDLQVLRHIYEDLGGVLALDTRVLEPGIIKLGDEAILGS